MRGNFYIIWALGLLYQLAKDLVPIVLETELLDGVKSAMHGAYSALYRPALKLVVSRQITFRRIDRIAFDVRSRL